MMNIRTQKATWTSISFAFALLSGAPVMADDTELLLITPDPTKKPVPNVMFILDTSGSMTSEQETNQPYDSNTDYDGLCDTNAVYWTDVNLLPVCDGKGTNKQWVSESNFHCNYAKQQMENVGSFADTMAQWRLGSPGQTLWQYLAPGYNKDPVECQADSGTHGDGRPSYLWVDAGTNVSDPFTNDSSRQVSWGSAPRNLTYTVYHGNYLNWKASPVLISLTRMEIMKDATKKVLKSINNMNVGVMQFNKSDGGVVKLALTDVNTNRAAIVSAVDSLSTTHWTPLSETLYENALYWLGLPAYYGEKISETATDPAALANNSPEHYKQPALAACAKNYNVLLTDGKPDHDVESHTLVPTLPNFTSITGRTACLATGEGGCLQDVAEYLGKVDTSVANAGVQTVTTHTIGFTIDFPLLRDTAKVSGGEYFLADDVEALTLALQRILTKIDDRSLSFSAPTVSVNTFNRTQNLNDLYLTMFGAKTSAHWPGNLKKYMITKGVITDVNKEPAVDPKTGLFYDTAKSFWTVGAADGNDVRKGGATKQLPDPNSRKLYTNNGSNILKANSNLITPSNAGAFTLADFGLTGAAGEPSIDDVIRWMRGEDIRNEDDNPTTTVRNAMGDPLHSAPATVAYGNSTSSQDVVVYVATNDGYLHAIDGATGKELWSFVPKQLLTNMTRLYFDVSSKYKQYGLDGNVVPIVKDSNNNGIMDDTDFAILIFGMRRGGSSYFALDVTDKNSPKLLWTKTQTGMGQSWSSPVIARVDIHTSKQNTDNAVVILGGGYDSVHDTKTHPSIADGSGAGVYMFDLKSGELLWRAGPDSGANRQLSRMTRAMPNEMRAIDMNGDGLIDRMYGSDLGGQIWRFDVLNGQIPDKLVNGGVIAQLGAEGLTSPGEADTRRFYTAPDVSMFSDLIQNRRFIAISIGSGYRAHPFDLSATDRFYSVRDADVFRTLTQTEYDNYSIIAESNLVDVSGKKQVVIKKTDRGWMFTLPGNQKVLSDSMTFDNSVYFVAFSPDNNSTVICDRGLGTNFLYRVNIVNGDPIVTKLDALKAVDADDARRTTLVQGGIAPSPTVLFPSPEEKCTEDCMPPPFACVGVECFDLNFPNFPVRTRWTQDGIY